jgi:lysophospholipase L1-like esterase
MKYLFSLWLVCVIGAASGKVTVPVIYKANNPYLHYVGRIDFTDKNKPRFWSPGVYVQARFTGTSLSIDLNDEVLYEKNHNYIEVVIDNLEPRRLQTTGKVNHIKIAYHLTPGIHKVTICKNTETNIGYLEFVGLTCQKLLPWIEHTGRKIEFIGNSITCGTGSDQSKVPCGKGVWQDQHNAYMSYGPRTARMLHAQWQLTAYSGIGLIRSCCGIKFAMPEIYGRVNLQQDSLNWDFNRYIPDVVTICLGQNDGVQDSAKFCKAYVDFINGIRKHYPKADIVMLTSPMGEDKLNMVLKNYITSVETHLHAGGDKKVSHYFYKSRYIAGCDSHPSLQEHRLIAEELSGYLKKLKSW